MNTIITTIEGIRKSFKEGLNSYCSITPTKSWVPNTLNHSTWISIFINNKQWKKYGITEEQFDYLLLRSFIENYYTTNAGSRNHSIEDINLSTKLYQFIASGHMKEAYQLTVLDKKTRDLLKSKFIQHINSQSKITRSETTNLLETFDNFSQTHLFSNKELAKKPKPFEKTIYNFFDK